MRTFTKKEVSTAGKKKKDQNVDHPLLHDGVFSKKTTVRQFAPKGFQRVNLSGVCSSETVYKRGS